MFRLLLCCLLVVFIPILLSAQILPTKFGKGIRILGKDSSYYMKIGARFQSLHTSSWSTVDGFDDYEGNFLIRRSRLKLDGFAFSPKLKYKFELGLSNRDLSGGHSPEFHRTANLILDAWVKWNFYKNFSVQFGQAKLPGNRERLLSSANLQFVDRSALNSRFNIDRGFGVQLHHHLWIGDEFLVRKTISLDQGEGRNVTAGYLGGYAFTAKIELLPFGEFQSKGDYIGGALKFEEAPKLAVAVAYDFNQDAARSRGRLGSFMQDEEGNLHGRDLTTIFADLMFKYRSLSIMSEYAKRDADGGPVITDPDGGFRGVFYTGEALSFQLGYMLPQNWEIAGRYTSVMPETIDVGEEWQEYTFGLSKYIVGHKLKVQSDFTYNSLEKFTWRFQTEIHF